jgi:hypothetical protein
MNRTRSIGVVTTVLAASLLAPPARAQVSEDRLKELIKQAGEAAKLPPVTFAEAQKITAQPGPTVQLTLDEAVALALERNLDIRVQRLNPERSRRT